MLVSGYFVVHNASRLYNSTDKTIIIFQRHTTLLQIRFWPGHKIWCCRVLLVWFSRLVSAGTLRCDNALPPAGLAFVKIKENSRQGWGVNGPRVISLLKNVAGVLYLRTYCGEFICLFDHINTVKPWSWMSDPYALLPAPQKTAKASSAATLKGPFILLVILVILYARQYFAGFLVAFLFQTLAFGEGAVWCNKPHIVRDPIEWSHWCWCARRKPEQVPNSSRSDQTPIHC